MHTSSIRTVTFSPDGKHFLTSSDDNKALVFNLTTGNCETEITLDKERLFKSCYSPDGNLILTMNDRNETIAWDAKTGEKTGTFKKSYTGSINSQWLTPGSDYIMAYSNYTEAKLISVDNQETKQVFNCEKPNSFAISPDGKFVAIGTSKLDAYLFELETGKEIYHFQDDRDKKCDGCNTIVLFSHNGKYIATAMRYTGLSVWDVKSGKRIHNFPFTEDQIDEITFSPDDNMVMATVDDESSIWNIKTGKKILKISNDGLECTPVFSPDEKKLLTISGNNTSTLRSIDADGKLKSKILRTYSGYLNHNREDGLKFMQNNWYHSNIIRYVTLKNKISISPNGKYIAKGNIDSVAVILNIETGKIEKIFQGHSKIVLSTDFSHDGKWLLTAGGDRQIMLWDIKTGELIRTFKGHRELIFEAKFSSDSKYIVSGSWDATFKVWETATGKLIKGADLENVSPYTIDFTPNDLYLTIGDLGGNFKLWEVDACKEFREIIGHTGTITSTDFSNDGKNMITASLDGKVKVWDMLSGMLVNKFTEHTSSVYSVIYNPDGNIAASGGNDRTIKLWNTDSGKLIKSLTGHSGGVTSIQITPDGKKLISNTVDGEIKVWDLKNYKEIYTYIQIDRKNWLVKNPKGYFDGTPNALKLINYVSGLDVITVNSLFEKYYTPNLLKRINDGEKFSEETSDLNAIINSTPTLKFEINQEISTENIDSVVWYKNTLPVSIEITDQGGGIDELRIYNNGKLIINEKYQNNQRRSGKKQTGNFEIPIASGINDLTAVAFNKDRIESTPAQVNVYFDGMESEMRLFILSVGINKYENPSYQLNYAIDDAKAYNKLIKKGAGNIFQSIEEYFIKDSEASKTNIEQMFNQIALKARPEDVFIFYFAGHGAMSSEDNDENSSFFIIPYDVTNIYGNHKLLQEKAISSYEILELSKLIKARKQLFILDACQSGGALAALNSRGANREKAIAQLARSTGTFFLLASGAVQFASEARELGHGIFTYAILEALEGKADGGNPDAKITASELKSYVEERVPELTRKYMLTPQYPTGYSFGQDFPIVLVK
jgi:WD40 repeat protein